MVESAFGLVPNSLTQENLVRFSAPRKCKAFSWEVPADFAADGEAFNHTGERKGRAQIPRS